MKIMNIKQLILIFLIYGTILSCSNEKESQDVYVLSTDAILIGAATQDPLNTRGTYDTDDVGNVKGGLFYLTYPKTDSKVSSPKYNRLYVDFDKAVYYSKYERYYAYTEGKESGSELTNALIGTSPNMLFLDNVAPASSTANNENDTIVKFPATDNPYTAGVMTSDKDIIWGSIQRHSSNLYNFELHHVMAGVRVKITVDRSGDDNLYDKYDLSKAEVYLTNLVLDPVSFTRTTGNVRISAQPVYSDKFRLVNNWGEHDDNETLEWGSVSFENPDDLENPGNPVYTTQNFILPPQTPSDEKWPQLVVRFPNPSPEEVAEGKLYKEFYGNVPRGMFTNYEEGTNYGLDLAFLREHILEIRTQISQNPPELIFMPVKVYNWVTWGPYTVIGHQEGIYDSQQLYQLIGYYEDDNTRMLEKFGELKEINGLMFWYFNIFSNLTLELDKIQGKMKLTTQAYPVTFNLNNHKIRITDSNGTVIYTITSNSVFNKLLTEGELPSEEQN